MQTETRTGAEPVVDTGCCPRFDPAAWPEGEVHWDGKLFVTEHVTTLFHLPLNMGKKMTEAMERIEAAGAKPDHPLMLAHEDSPFGTDLFIDVTKPVPDTRMASLVGTFVTKVFEGPYGNQGKWAHDMRSHVAAMGKKVRRLYFAYTTCPRCARYYGENYVVAFAQVD